MNSKLSYAVAYLELNEFESEKVYLKVKKKIPAFTDISSCFA